MGTGGKLQLEEGTAGGTFVGFKAPDTEVTNDLIWTLPSADGAAGELFGTDGSKNIVWVPNMDSSLQAAIDSEESARLEVDSSLYTAINAQGTEVFEGTATAIDALGTFSHGFSSFPLTMTLLVDVGSGFWEQHDAGSFFKISTTHVAPAGESNLVTIFGGSTNVKLFVTKTQSL